MLINFVSALSCAENGVPQRHAARNTTIPVCLAGDTDGLDVLGGADNEPGRDTVGSAVPGARAQLVACMAPTPCTATPGPNAQLVAQVALQAPVDYFTLALPQQPHPAGARTHEAQGQVHTPVGAATIVHRTLVLITVTFVGAIGAVQGEVAPTRQRHTLAVATSVL